MKQHFKRVFAEIFNNNIEINNQIELNNQTEFPYAVDPAELPESTQHLLSAYIEAELDGRKAADLFPEVETAIANFPEFAEEYQILYEILDADRRGELEQPPYTPAFDFSYLLAQSTQNETDAALPPPWNINLVGRLIIQFSEDLIDSLAAQPMQLAPVRHTKAEDDWQTWLEYKLPRPTADLDIIVSVKHSGSENDFCNVVVTVDIPSQGGWPNLADSQVQLSRPGFESESLETDAFGKVVFEGIEKKHVPYLKFEVNPINQ